MLLRRFVAHARKQDWMAIAIEFVLLVLGVFLGIQVANWNAERDSRQNSALFTERLKADLRGEDWTYQFLVAYNREVLANANRAADALEGKAALADEALLVSAYRATQYRSRNQLGTTYDELISTGNIGLIHDQTLRGTSARIYNLAVFDSLARHIQTYYGNYDDLLDTQTNVFRIFRTEGVVHQQYPMGLSVFDQRPASDIVALARDNPGFAAYLRSQREWAILNWNLLHNSSLETKALRLAIDKELAAP